jgi:hypothetical protein
VKGRKNEQKDKQAHWQMKYGALPDRYRPLNNALHGVG